ncbi:hypothetical protein KHP62_14890 [Rhodobacteraceae bacterium NNCM2]|nr:hypothetical protein [Coraliihabitans acroporae]
MRRLILPALGAFALVSLLVTGPTAFGKLALLLRYPGTALAFINDPAARGAALYKLGRYNEADAVFEEIGRSATYNRANTLALTGSYELSVAYYDAVLFANRWDGEARHNREVVDRFVTPVIGEATGSGRIAAILVEHGANPRAFDPENPHAAVAPPADNFRKPMDATSVAATREWLNTLADAPGEYLKRRLAAEHERRIAEGVAAPEEASPW